MLNQILAYSPAGVCLFWMVRYAITCRDRKRFLLTESVLLIITIFLAFETIAWIKTRANGFELYPYAEWMTLPGAMVLFFLLKAVLRVDRKVIDIEVIPDSGQEGEAAEAEDPAEEYYEVPAPEPKRPVFNDADLKARFESLMIDEQLFLTQGVTLSDIAARLNSNKTYISRLVNTNYNTTFPEYLNSLRIDYAEQYILHHRDAKQVEIAKACGFPSASAFNNTFKKVTGETPRAWLASKK